MRFLGSKFTQNALGAGAPPRTSLGELKGSPDSLPIQGAAKGKGKEGKEGGGKAERGYWGRERKGRGEGGKGEGGGTRGEGEFASLALGGIDAPGNSYHNGVLHSPRLVLRALEWQGE